MSLGTKHFLRLLTLKLVYFGLYFLSTKICEMMLLGQGLFVIIGTGEDANCTV